MSFQGGVGGGRILQKPCTIVLERMFSTVGLAARFTFLLNGVQVCSIKYKETGVFTTQYELNSLTIKGGWIGKEFDFTAYDGATIKIFNMGGAFISDKTEYIMPEQTNYQTANNQPPNNQPPPQYVENFCSSCGTRFLENAKFCSKCGAIRK